MRIGEIAAQAGLNVQTIRFYEREGLLRKPARTPSGYRAYEHQDLERIKFIQACQELGFTLREVKQLIRLHCVSDLDHATMTPESVREIISIAEERVASIEEKMKALSRMRAEMQRVIRHLSLTASPKCPVGGAESQRRRKTSPTLEIPS